MREPEKICGVCKQPIHPNCDWAMRPVLGVVRFVHRYCGRDC
jgi:hypothetical protein